MDLKSAYIVTVIRKFAEYFLIPSKQAYQYLKAHSGISYLDECYEAEHQLSFDDAIQDLARVCQIHGGTLRYD